MRSGRPCSSVKDKLIHSSPPQQLAGICNKLAYDRMLINNPKVIIKFLKLSSKPLKHSSCNLCSSKNRTIDIIIGPVSNSHS